MIRRIARMLVGFAAALLPEPLRDWGQAMRTETEAIARPLAALAFAFGCLACAVREAIAFHARSVERRADSTAEAAFETGTTGMTSDDHRLLGPRQVAILCAAGAVGLGFVHMAMAGAPGLYFVMNGAALLLGTALFMALSVTPGGGRSIQIALDLALAAALLLTSLWGVSAEGATRWLSVGGVLIQPGLLLVPLLVMRFANACSGYGTMAVMAAAAALALQPDRAMAGALAAGLCALAMTRRDRHVLIALAAALAGLAVTFVRPDASRAASFVDQIFYSSFEVHPLAGLALILGTLLLLAPAAVGLLRDPLHRTSYGVFGAVWLAVVAAAMLGNHPTPLVGYGGSAILGYLLSLTGLPARTSAVTVTQEFPAASSREDDRNARLRGSLSCPA